MHVVLKEVHRWYMLMYVRLKVMPRHLKKIIMRVALEIVLGEAMLVMLVMLLVLVMEQRPQQQQRHSYARSAVQGMLCCRQGGWRQPMGLDETVRGGFVQKMLMMLRLMMHHVCQGHWEDRKEG